MNDSVGSKRNCYQDPCVNVGPVRSNAAVVQWLYSDCTEQSVQLSHMTPLERVKFPTPGQARPDSVMSAHVRSLLIWQSELISPSYHNQLSSLSRQTSCWFDSFKVSQPAVRTDHRQLTPADQWSESQDLSPWFCLLCLCLPCCVSFCIFLTI